MKINRELYTIYNYNLGIQLVRVDKPIKLLFIIQNDKIITENFIKVDILESDKFLINYTEEQLNILVTELGEYDNIHIETANKIVNEIIDDISDRRGLKSALQKIIDENEFLTINLSLAKEVSNMIKNDDESLNIINFIQNELSKYDVWKDEWSNIDDDILSEVIDSWNDIFWNNFKS